MELKITFFIDYDKYKESIRATCYVNDNILGYGKNDDDAIADYMKKFNDWSEKMGKQTEEIILISHPEFEFSVKKLSLVKI